MDAREVVPEGREVVPEGREAAPEPAVKSWVASWPEDARRSPWRLALLVGLPVVGIAVALGAWALWPGSRDMEMEDESTAELSEPEPTAGPEPAGPAAPSQPSRFDRRWLPKGTGLVVCLRVSSLAEHGEFQGAITAADSLWRPSVGRIFDAFKLMPRNVRRITWAAADLSAWDDAAVALIELEERQDATGFRNLGEAVDVQVAGSACRRLATSPWPHPFAVLDERTMVTGRKELLRELADRTEPSIASPAVDRLLKAVAPDADLLAVVDLNVARNAGWRLPNSLWDLWPAGRVPWHAICEIPQGLGLAVQKAAPGRSEIILACEGETAAMKVHAAIEQLVPAARTALEAAQKSITAKLEAGRLTAHEADQYEMLLEQGQAALGTAKWEIAEPLVLLRIEFGRRLPATAGAALDSRRAIRADWLDAARAADEANHRRLLMSIAGYVKAEGHFPAGVGGDSLLAPETRLSWIASMLPYFDHREWHRELQFSYSWNSPQNRRVTQQRLESVVNPALGPSSTDAGFPVTHYVGVAGVGADAAELKTSDRRAGLFGYWRTPRLEDITDGASNTLATLGVSGRLGAWAAGGNATVRALTKPPYVNGPDGFGSGQPDGMLAGMADGSVRFLSKDVDPLVLEQLATIGGGEKQTVAALTPKSPPAVPAPPTAEARGKGPAEPGKGSRRAATEKAPEAVAPGSAALPRAEEAMAEEAEGEDTPSLPTLDDAEAAKVDLRARLADRVPEVDFPGVPILDAMRFMSRMSTVPVSFDLDGMRVLGAKLRDPVTLKMTKATTGEVFQAIAADRGLTCEAAGAQLLVTVPLAKRRALRSEKYSVADLVGKDAAAGAELGEWVARLIAPETWRRAGGQGTVEFAQGTLVVTQTDAVHFQVREFCDRLRMARGKSPEGRAPGDGLALATHVDQARAKLSQAVTASFPEPTPLAQIAAELERLGRATIVFDGVTLAASGLSPQRKGTLSVHNRPLYEALVSLLQPLGLTYRIVDAGTFEITTRKAAAARLELEFYPVAGILAKGTSPEALMERIKAQLAGATWNDAGGPGAMVFDRPSNCLLVLQSQPVQAKLELLLGRL
jgi:hypothetical protein